MDEISVRCPYCGETISVLIDPTQGGQTYIEDCEVCCRPIEFTPELAGDQIQLMARRDDE